MGIARKSATNLAKRLKETHWGLTEGQGEKALLAAMISMAVRDAVMGRKLESLQCERDARTWLLSDSREPFSYLWACQHLSLSPDIILNEIYPYR